MNFNKNRECKVNGYELYNLRYMAIIGASLTSLMQAKTLSMKIEEILI